MIRLMAPAATVTASQTVKYQPVQGYKWRVLSLVAYISTGSTAGTRSVDGVVQRAGNTAFPNFPAFDFLIGSTTSTGVTDTFAADGVNPAASNGVTSGLYNLVISSADVLQVALTLISGDSAYYVLEVEEMLDD